MTGAPRPVRRAVAVAINAPGGAGELILVRRPQDDPDLPGVWGLPAASLHTGESEEDAVRRAGREKLGVELAVGPAVNRGRTERSGYTLEMTVYAAAVSAGEPAVPQPHPGVTQYTAWRPGRAEELRPAAERGSLCSRLYLEVAD